MKRQSKAIRSIFAALVRRLIPALVGMGVIAAANAADIQKPLPPTVLPKVHPGAVQSPTMLPDLVVERAAFDSNCNILVTLSNRSKGGITIDQYRRLTVETAWQPTGPRGAVGPQTSRRPLTEMDRNGQLRKPGGTISASTGVHLRGDHFINVFVDDGQKLPELDEDNNRFSGVLTAPDTCR